MVKKCINCGNIVLNDGVLLNKNVFGVIDKTEKNSEFIYCKKCGTLTLIKNNISGEIESDPLACIMLSDYILTRNNISKKDIVEKYEKELDSNIDEVKQNNVTIKKASEENNDSSVSKNNNKPRYILLHDDSWKIFNEEEQLIEHVNKLQLDDLMIFELGEEKKLVSKKVFKLA